MGFPDSFRIPVSDTQAYRQFGNSVVVPAVTAVARLMVASLHGRPLVDRPGAPKLPRRAMQLPLLPAPMMQELITGVR
jgi:hypothetical protein